MPNKPIPLKVTACPATAEFSEEVTVAVVAVVAAGHWPG
jgi:hypothetical protein